MNVLGLANALAVISCIEKGAKVLFNDKEEVLVLSILVSSVRIKGVEGKLSLSSSKVCAEVDALALRLRCADSVERVLTGRDMVSEDVLRVRMTDK